MIRTRTCIAAVALAAAAVGGAPALADGKNEIRAVAFDEDGGTTRIRVRGAQTPTFTVYKLERPARVVVDVPQARLADALRRNADALVAAARTWAVSSIATEQIDDGGAFVRVVISLARPARYDVKTAGNELVVLVTATEAKPAAGKPAAGKPAAGKPAAGKPAADKPAAARAKIDDIRFQGGGDRGEVAIAVTGAAAVRLGEITATQVELVVDRAELAAPLERKLDVSRFGSPVRAVSSFRDRRVPDRVRLIAELSRPVTPTLDRDGGVLRWRFAAATGSPAPAPVGGGFGATSTPIAQQSVAQVPQPSRRRVYRGATINLEVKDAPIHDLLRLIADTGRVNIVVPDTINPRVTVRLQRVPWDQALEVILASHGLWYRREGNLYRIATRKELDAEDEAEAARREAAIRAEVPRPEIVSLNYASAADLKPKLEGMLSGRPGSKLEVDERSNQLIINDIAGNRDQIARLALALDTQTPQISIEARIVEARSTFLRQIGVQWGGRALAGADGGNATGLIWPSSIRVIGGNEDAQTVRGGVASPSDFAVNLPAATGSGEGGAIGLSLGSIGGNFNINLRLSALEDSGTVRIISAPKITVLNNKQAKISQGVSIPISVISAAGTQTQFVQADLALEVTPYVSQRDCAIAMSLKVTKNEPDFVNVGARGDPTILRKEASTSMLVSDGETSVLGGIYTRNSGLAYKKIPFFGDLPVLGWLFKNRRENDDRTEILVFITPKITNRALLRCQ
jgi:type IV pilus assembly protein PilQ